MHIGKKVGEFSYTQRHRLSPSLGVETTYEGDIIQEHTITQKAKQEMEANFKKFAEKYGMSTTGAEEPTKKRGRKAQDESSETLSKFQDQFIKAIGAGSIDFKLEAPERRQEIKTTKTADLEREVADALVNLNSLKAYLGPNSAIAQVTENDLRNSKTLRTQITEYKGFYFFTAQNTPKSFKK